MLVLIKEKLIEYVYIYYNCYIYYLLLYCIDPPLDKLNDRIFSRIYEVCVKRFNSFTSSILSVFNHLKYSVKPNTNIGISKDGLITCYSEEKKSLSEYTVSFTDFNGSLSTKLYLEFKSIYLL